MIRKDLADKITDYWDFISDQYLNKICDCIPRRLFEVPEKNCGPSNYQEHTVNNTKPGCDMYRQLKKRDQFARAGSN